MPILKSVNRRYLTRNALVAANLALVLMNDGSGTAEESVTNHICISLIVKGLGFDGVISERKS